MSTRIKTRYLSPLTYTHTWIYHIYCLDLGHLMGIQSNFLIQQMCFSYYDDPLFRTYIHTNTQTQIHTNTQTHIFSC